MCVCVGICPRFCSICIYIYKYKYRYKNNKKENENKNCWPVCVSVFVQGCVAGGQNGRGGGSSLKFVPTPIHDVFHVYLLPFLDVSRLCIPKYTKVIVYCTWMSTKENSMISIGHGQMLAPFFAFFPSP